MCKSEPCYCGALDCPECYPGSLEKVECAVCGNVFPRWQMGAASICARCQEEGYGECANCGNVEILVDSRQCAVCWNEKRELERVGEI